MLHVGGYGGKQIQIVEVFVYLSVIVLPGKVISVKVAFWQLCDKENIQTLKN